MFPPSIENLKLHLKQSNYVACALQHSRGLQLNLDSPSLHGWDENSVSWIDPCFSHDIHYVLTAAKKEKQLNHHLNHHLGVDFREDDDTDIKLEDFT